MVQPPDDGAPREAWVAYFEACGAVVKTSTTRSCNFVLVGENPGRTKIDRAKELGIPILSWAMFDYLSLGDQREHEHHFPIPEEMFNHLILNMTTTLEELYAYNIRHDGDDPNLRAAFDFGSIAVESLLQAARGRVSTAAQSADESDPADPNDIVIRGG